MYMNTEDGVDDVVSALQRRCKVFGERNIKAPKLGRETLKTSAAAEKYKT